MNILPKSPRLLRAPRLTRKRIILAVTVALLADLLQFCLGPAGWVLPDQIIDVGAMIVTIRLLGFHILLLPTFVVNFIPMADELPTWIACVLAVIFLRKREQRSETMKTVDVVTVPQEPPGTPPRLTLEPGQNRPD